MTESKDTQPFHYDAVDTLKRKASKNISLDEPGRSKLYEIWNPIYTIGSPKIIEESTINSVSESRFRKKRPSAGGTDEDELISAKIHVNLSDKMHKITIFDDVTNLKCYQTNPDNTVRSHQKNCSIILAVKSGSESVVRALIAAGADVNITDNERKTALFYAVQQSNNERVVRALIDAGADVNITDSEGKTALFYAVQQSNNERVVRALIDAGANVNRPDYQGKTALFYAVQQSNNESVVGALIDVGANVNRPDCQGKTALFYAVLQSNNESVVGALIDVGANVNRPDCQGKTALFYAVQQSNNESVVRALIAAGADVNRTDKFFWEKTALSYAVQQSNNESVVCALIDAGVDVDKIDNEGKTALFYAVQQSGNESVARALIAAGADVNQTDNEGKTALFYAVQQSNNESVVHALIEECKANINTKDIYGRTPLFYAIVKSLNLAQYLLDKGANLHLKDNCGVSILSFFIEDCILNKYDGLLPNMDDVIDFLITEHGVKRKTVFKTIVNVVFCQFLRVLVTSQIFRNTEQTLQSVQSIGDVLQLLKNYVKEEKKQESRDLIDAILENIKQLLTNDGTAVVPNVLELLIKLGANPTDSVDSDGNTSIHFVAQLSLLDNSQEKIQEMLTTLENCEFGNLRKLENHQHETPLVSLFSWSRDPWKAIYIPDNQLPNIGAVNAMCRFLLEHGSSVEETSRTGKTVFHWILGIIQKVLLWLDTPKRNEALTSLLLLFELFSSQNGTKEVTVNQKDANDGLNTPLHLWASLQLGPVQDYASNITEDLTFEKMLKKILSSFIKDGVQLNSRNKNDETPLHLCKTWTAVKLLLDAGVNPNDLDASGCSPLLVAAKKRTAKNGECLYPDVSLQPLMFWEAVLKKKLDPWMVDVNGDSILSILVKSEAFDLAKALVEVACERTYAQQGTVLISLINAICRDESPVVNWKRDLVEIILKSHKATCSLQSDEGSPLHFCCRNIVSLEKAKSGQHPVTDETKKRRVCIRVEHQSSKKAKFQHCSCTASKVKNPLDMDNVHWRIAKLLLLYGADCRIPDAEGESCLDIAKECPMLKDLLVKPIDISAAPLAIPWISVSDKHQSKLSKVARLRECCHVDQIWYHQDHLASSSFGTVFAGIDEKDGREVAIKRIEKMHMQQRPEVKQEIMNLMALADCEQVVNYLFFFQDKNFSYIVLELMEGNLDEYLDSTFDVQKSVKLCQGVVQGLKYLHQEDITHCNLKPTNILYKVHPKLCLKIADFGLSRCINSSFTTVYGTNAGTRCWIAPEVLNSTKEHSTSSDMFACGLVLHYILSVKKHPFAPADCANKNELQIDHETKANILRGCIEGWDNSLCPEATHLIKAMLDSDDSKRPAAAEALDHPFFWTQEKKAVSTHGWDQMRDEIKHAILKQ